MRWATARVCAHYFLGETQVHVQKQTKIKMNDNDSPKLEGGAPTALKLWGQVVGAAGALPPPPGSRVPDPNARYQTFFLHLVTSLRTRLCLAELCLIVYKPARQRPPARPDDRAARLSPRRCLAVAPHCRQRSEQTGQDSAAVSDLRSIKPSHEEDHPHEQGSCSAGSHQVSEG